MNRINSKLAGEESEQRVPTDLSTALLANPITQALWGDLTPTERRDFVNWVGSAKQPETPKNRIQKACDMLTAGKRHP